MPYVITSSCLDVLDKSCVEEGPVDCIHEGARAVTEVDLLVVGADPSLPVAPGHSTDP